MKFFSKKIKLKMRALACGVLISCFACSSLTPAVSAEEGAQKEIPYVPVRTISLQDCLIIALRNSFEVAIAKLDLLIAETDRMYAESVFDTVLFGEAGYTTDKRKQLSILYPDNSQTNVYAFGLTKKLPTGTEITASYGDTRYWVNSAFGVLSNPTHTSELVLEARQPVGRNFFGYVDRNTVSVTNLAIKNAGLETKDNIEAFLAEVEKAYWRLVFEKRSLRIHRDILDKAKKLHETNTKNFDIGLIEKGDFYASEGNVRMREADLIIAENGYKKQEENLKLLLNMNEDVLLSPADEFSPRIRLFDLADCLTEAFEKRRDYQVDKRDTEIKNITLKMKRNELWPEIDLVGSMTMNGIDRKIKKAIDETAHFENKCFYGGVEVSFPLENRAARSEARKARFDKEKAIVKLKQTERSIITEVGNAFRDVLAYEASLVNVKQAVQLEGEKLTEEEKRFKYGRSNTKKLIDYQNDLLTAEMEEARYLLNHQVSYVDLERSMNIILEKCEAIL